MIRIGIIGCGKIAQVRHLPEYAANPHVELAGYYDLNTQRAQEMAAQYGGKVYDSYFDLLNDPSIDAVSICVENRSHAEITTYALYAGKHVLCEKPMAVTLAECESMVAAAERNGKHLMIGHNMRFDPVHRKAKELLFTGARMSAQEAQAIGMVNRVVPDAELADAALALAQQIAKAPPFGLRLIKRSINRTLDAQGLRSALAAHFDTHQLSHLSDGFLSARDRGLASAIQKNPAKAEQ